MSSIEELAAARAAAQDAYNAADRALQDAVIAEVAATGNATAVAKRAGITRMTVHRWLERRGHR